MKITNLIVCLGLFWSASAMFYVSITWQTRGDFMFVHVTMAETIAAGLLTLFALVKVSLWIREAVR